MARCTVRKPEARATDADILEMRASRPRPGKLIRTNHNGCLTCVRSPLDDGSHHENPNHADVFLQASSAAALAAPAILRGAVDSDKLNLALIGPGGMGTQHLRTLCRRDDVNFLWVIDADANRAAAGAKEIEELTGQKPKSGAGYAKGVGRFGGAGVFYGDTGSLACARGDPGGGRGGNMVYVEKPLFA